MSYKFSSNELLLLYTLSCVIGIFAGSVAVIIALLTVGSHAIKAAASNPVKSLRSE